MSGMAERTEILKNQGKAGRRSDGTFAPGHSGNPRGRPPRRDLNAAIDRFIKENHFDIDKAAGDLLEHLYTLATQENDIQAAKEWLNRAYGAVPKEIDITNVSTVQVADEARSQLKELAAEQATQRQILDELEDRTLRGN